MTTTDTRPVPGIHDTNAQFAAIIAADLPQATTRLQGPDRASTAHRAKKLRPWYAVLLPLIAVLALALLITGTAALITQDETTRQTALLLGCLMFTAAALVIALITYELYGPEH